MTVIELVFICLALLVVGFSVGFCTGEQLLENRLMRKIAQWAKEDAMVYVVPDEAE